MKKFLSYANIIQLTDDIVYKTIERKKLKKIKTPDAIIASSALVNDHTLITNYTADFKHIPGLKVFNPYVS